MSFLKKGSKPEDDKAFHTSKVEATPGAPSPSAPPPDGFVSELRTPGQADPNASLKAALTPALVTQESLKSKVVPQEEPKNLPGDWTRVNLKCVVGINGTNYGPGENILVPTDAFELWRNALADGKE